VIAEIDKEIHEYTGITLTSFYVGYLLPLMAGLLIVWVVLFHRKRSDRVPDQVRYNLPIEVLYTVLPFIMIGVLFFFTARDENYIDKLSAHPDVVVNVIGFQWSWEFQYPQYRAGSPKSMNRVKGASNVVTELGAMWNPNQYFNHQRLPVLEIPEHKTVRFNLVSRDVVHSFWIVPFEFKRDVHLEVAALFDDVGLKHGDFSGPAHAPATAAAEPRPERQ